jgi:hypothetical protein
MAANSISCSSAMVLICVSQKIVLPNAIILELIAAALVGAVVIL